MSKFDVMWFKMLSGGRLLVGFRSVVPNTIIILHKRILLDKPTVDNSWLV